MAQISHHMFSINILAYITLMGKIAKKQILKMSKNEKNHFELVLNALLHVRSA